MVLILSGFLFGPILLAIYFDSRLYLSLKPPNLASRSILQTVRLRWRIGPLKLRRNFSPVLLTPVDHETRRVPDPFCLDRINECLRSGSRSIKLRPKAFAVLNQLIEHSGKLVTKEELLNTVWPETFVGDAVLKVTIRQLRTALNDDSNLPRFIETAHRRGYRFIGQIVDCGESEIRDESVVRDGFSQEFVGRGHVVSRMGAYLEKMLRGERQIIFVTGEAGIGKTTLVDAFARTITDNQYIRMARGQCLEHYGTSEAYLPFLEAFGRLCREQQQVIEVLRTHAPMWLLQLPSLVSASEREALSREMTGATRERMLREIGDALETLTTDLPLVLILEDLHWSDYSTLDLISYLARQRQVAHLMLIGTYRPVELIVSGHPLKAVKQELLAKQQCEELPLEYLSTKAVEEYLLVRFPNNRFPKELAALIHERTEGNPLFMVNAVDYLQAEGLIIQTEGWWELVANIETVQLGVPDSIRQMIEKQLDHLDPDEQRTLEAVSVAGTEVSAHAVVVALGEDRASVEARCDELARRRQFIQDCGVQELPNGEASPRYGFIHALYQNVLYERVSPSQRVHLHRRIGQGGEDAYRDRSKEIAAELAMHFERGRDFERAAKYLQQAADNAVRRFAYPEAVGLARRGLDLLGILPDSRERSQRELRLQLTLGVPLVATTGYAAPEVGNAYRRARELCKQLDDPPDVSEALWGLWTFHTLGADLVTARETAEELLRLAEYLPYPQLAMSGNWAMEITFTHLGEFALAIEHFEKALSLYDAKEYLDMASLYALSPGVAMPCFAALSLWYLGQPDASLARIREATTLARELAEPHSLAHAFLFSSFVHQLRREQRIAQEHASAVIAISIEHGLVMYQAMATIMAGWSLIDEGQPALAIEQIKAGLVALKSTGTELVRPHFLALLADALGTASLPEEGLTVLDEAVELVNRTQEAYYLAELYRLKGELLLIQSNNLGGDAEVNENATAVARAKECFHDAIRIARQQKAKSWELRASMSLARLYQQLDKREAARNLLAEIYDTFHEGFETADLREAKALLDELS